jgi:hypothetical protein
MAEEDNAAALLEGNPDSGDDVEPQDEELLEDQQGEDGSGDHWDQGQGGDDEFDVEVLVGYVSCLFNIFCCPQWL